MTESSPPAAQLREAVLTYSATAGETTIGAFQGSSSLVAAWLDYFANSVSQGTCDEIIVACRAALIEAAGCLSLGLVRPAVFAIRLQFELFLAWPYFNDHPVEWKSWQEGRSEFPLRAENLKYLRKHNPRFELRISLLEKHSSYLGKDPYGILSKVVHGSAYETMPDFAHFKAIVMDEVAVNRCIELQAEIAEYLSDVAAAWLTDRWHDIPISAKDSIGHRLNPADLKELCKA